MLSYRKYINFFVCFFLLFFVFKISTIKAENEFSVDQNVIYNVQDSGTTSVKHNITIENNFSTLYATSYTISLDNIDATNIKAEGSDGTFYPVDVSDEGNITNIKVDFPDSSVGKGTKRKFSITYSNTNFAVRTGEVWEISIPRVSNDNNYRNFDITLNIPKSFGQEAYISPQPLKSEINDNGYTYIFSNNSLLQSGVSAGFGQFQVFTFNLSYHLENPITKTTSTEIALPPDTAFQKVYLQKINPKPSNVILDQDGNWLAIYDLKPRQRIDINVSGAVQIFASYRSFQKPESSILSDNLKETEYWQVNNPEIKKLALELKTPKAIYDYVSKTLHYDSERVQPNVQRMGAVAALENPNKAICMEFTDLFIALARSAGIPAREINGYAYTENPDIQPIGLVADVLHSWPEYYDKDKGVWIPVDPTWGSTTGGVDFFDKLDLRHFVFVIHGESDKEPFPPGSYKLGPNPQKDVFVSFGQLPENKISVPQVTISPYRILPFFSSIYMVNISNPGPTALYGLYPVVYYDSIEKTRDFIDSLPPFSKKQIEITVPSSLLGKDMPSVIKVSIGSSNAQVLTNKKQIVTYSLLAFSVILIITVVIILFRYKKSQLIALFDRIISRFTKKHEEPINKTSEKEVNS